MFTLILILIRRTRRYWQVLATLSLGVILATALLASGPVLVDTAIEFGLRRTLLNADPAADPTGVPTGVNLRLVTSAAPDATRYRDLDAQVQRFVFDHFVAARLGHVLDQIVPAGGTRWAFPWVEGKAIADQRVNLQFYGADVPGMLAHAELVADPLPDTPRITGQVRPQPDVVAALVGEAMAQAYGLQVGDRLPLSVEERASAPQFWIQVAGIVRPLDSQDPYWSGALSPLRSQSSKRYSAQFSALVPRDAFFSLAADWFAPSEVELSWNVLLAPGAMTLDDLPRLRARLATLADDVSALNDGIRAETSLDATLAAFASQAETIRTPLYFLTATVVLLALYYVTMTTALSLRQFQREFAVLRSRGASGWQLFRVQLLEASLMGGVAILSGPALALLFVRGLATWGPLADVGRAEWVPTFNLQPATCNLLAAAWLAAIVGAIACMGSLLAPVPAALRRSIVTHQHSLARADRPPWWQRMYLDVFVLLAGLILIWRLRIVGSIIGIQLPLGSQTAQPQVDWLLLLSPLALLLGSATILLRVLPLLLNLGAKLASRGPGLPAALALWQIARDPTHIARLVLLLTLAMALGLFSTGLNATLDRNEADQSRYAAGSDLRLVDLAPDSPTQNSPTQNSLIRAVASAWRGQGTLALQLGGAYPTFDLLAIEPQAFAQVAQYRSDFATRPMPELLEGLQADIQPQPTLPLPGQPGRLGVWLWMPQESLEDLNLERAHVEAKLQSEHARLSPEHDDPHDTLLLLRLDMVEEISKPGEGWLYLEGELPTKRFPVSLHSLWIRIFTPYAHPIYQLALDDLTVTDAETGETRIVDGFVQSVQPPVAWHVYGGPVTVERGLVAPRSGAKRADEFALNLDFGPDGIRSGRWYGLQLVGGGPTDSSIPALVSPAFQEIMFAETAQLQVGDRVGTWVNSEPTEFQVVGVVRYFPTMYQERDAGFVVAALDPLLFHFNGISQEIIRPNELFVATEPGVSANALAAAAAAADMPDPFDDVQVWEAEAIRKSIKADPMALGLRSVTLFGYILTAVLSLAGFGTHFYMSTRQRGRNYVVLRALGLSPRQLYGILLFEQLLLILCGLALGTVLGLLLNRLTLPGLPLSLGGRPPVPPFLAETDWGAVGRIYLTLVIAFLLSLGLATGLLWRARLHRLLRVDEE